MIVSTVGKIRPPGGVGKRRTVLSACLAASLLAPAFAGSLGIQAPGSGITKAAADSCDAKIKRLESFDAERKTGAHQTTQFTDTEWNSYLGITLKPNYHPCLKEIRLKFEEGRLEAVSTIDFDSLNFNSTGSVNSLLRAMLTGVHTMTIHGRLVSEAGKANFQLEEARFDSITLPNLLVTEIIGAVGRRQNPPFDPTQPNSLPYHIQKVEVHAGYIIVNQ
jgi:hypothetical protein